jgi:hypothetical protein
MTEEMSMRTTLTLTTAMTAVLAAGLMTAGPAAAHGGDTILRSGFEGNIPLTAPNPTPVIGGVNPAGAPWILDDNSKVRVREDGRISVKLRGLVLTNTGLNPIGFVAASLVCDDKVVDTTERFELSIPEGDGRTDQVIDVPKDCDDPVVLIRNANTPGVLGGYFAFTDDKHHD